MLDKIKQLLNVRIYIRMDGPPADGDQSSERVTLDSFDKMELNNRRKQANITRTAFMVMETSTSDITPKDQDERIEYVGRVADYYRDIGQQQIKQVYNNIMFQLEKPDNSSQMDATLKGCLMGLRAMDKNYKILVAENNGYKFNQTQNAQN